MYNKELNIGGLKPKLPIIQGGMGVGISLHSLAGHIAKAGGIGLLSAAQIGFKEPDFLTDNLAANCRAIHSELKLAREIAPEGIVGINIMVASKDYKELVEAAVDAGVDIIVSGAGLPVTLPEYTKGSNVKLAPIVSSGRAANIILRQWDRHYGVIPDLIVIEGPLAGGHLGFSVEDLENPRNVLDILPEVREVAKKYEEKYNKYIPIVVAGGIFDGNDVREALEAGADGVQMATRFVTTYECDAPDSFKQAYIDAKEDEIKIIKSPVGMPGRAIINDFLANTPGNKACLYHCLAKCAITTIPYCISNALVNSASGNNQLVFCGQNASKCTKIEHVSDIMEELGEAIGF